MQDPKRNYHLMDTYRAAWIPRDGNLAEVPQQQPGVGFDSMPATRAWSPKLGYHAKP